MINSLFSFMKMIPDPRSRRRKKHDQAEVLTCLIIALSTGQNSLRECLSWLRGKESWLRAHTKMKLRGGIASLPTVSRMLSRIDTVEFSLIIAEWTCELVGPAHRKAIAEGRMPHIAIDGKALRGSGTHEKEHSRPPMVMNAYDAETGLVLTQLPIKDKGCELKEMPNLMKIISMRGCMVTIDAAGTFDTIMDQITGSGAHFLLPVKDNQLLAKDEIIEAIKGFDVDKKAREKCGSYDRYTSIERNRGRNEYREVKCCQDESILEETRIKWPWVKTYGISHQIRILHTKDDDGRDTTPSLGDFLRKGSWRQPKEDIDASGSDDKKSANQLIGLVSDVPLTAKEMAKIKREHWAIENNYHHVMDDTFREDHSKATSSKDNLALLRKIAYDIIQMITNGREKESGSTFPEKRRWLACREKQLISVIFEKTEPARARF